MDGQEDIVVIALTRREAQELFMRCLRSHEDDNAESAAVLNKLARLLESRPQREKVAT